MKNDFELYKEYLKDYVELYPHFCWHKGKTPKEVTDEVLEAYLEGAKFAEKRIKDSYNKYNSQLKDLKSTKLSKRIDEEKIKELEIRIETIKELIN